MHQTAILRTATATDAEAVRALTRDAYLKWVPVIGREPLPMRADYARAVREHRIDLLHVDGALAALVEMILRPDDLLVENLAVAPSHQGSGFGRRMLAHAETVAAGLGHDTVRLYTNRAFAANLRFYLRAGYAVEHEAAFMGGVVVHMRKTLNGAASH